MTSDFNILPDYADNKFLYTVEEFDNLSRLIMFNVRLNRKKILDCILSKMQKTWFGINKMQMICRFQEQLYGFVKKHEISIKSNNIYLFIHVVSSLIRSNQTLCF